MASRAVKILDGGKLVIPAGFRRALGLNVGDTVILDIADGQLHLRSRTSAVAEARRMMRDLIPNGESLVDELIADRRAEEQSDA